ncbi:MAG: 3',5'-cyclic-nucleotide phosphodiesterase [Methylophilaceae bacterium]
MQIKILGCSGGIGGKLRTTSILLDDDILIDAGSGVGDLSMDALMAINHVFITHSHLDHVAFLPFLLDTVFGFRTKPITVYGCKATLEALRNHIFNWEIWPDFNAIPSVQAPFLQYQEIQVNETIALTGRTITALPANHAVPALGYLLDSGKASLAFTGDTTVCDALWASVNNVKNLKYLIIETAFRNSEIELAKLSKHLCPSMLADELSQLASNNVEVYITHLKPGEGETIMQEIAEGRFQLNILALQHSQVFML